MSFRVWLKNIFSKFFKKNIIPQDLPPVQVEMQQLSSKFLKRKVRIDVHLPPLYYENNRHWPVIFFNDGQDLVLMQMPEILNEFYKEKNAKQAIIIGVHAGNRIAEYGTARTLDYANRGAKSEAYQQFILQEMLPFLKNKYRFSTKQQDLTFAGFSLGGLSALDLVWHHPDFFGRVGVFSGALWWRSRPFQENDPDADRIMHDTIAASSIRKGMKFWFQTGTNDEKEDRNKNGIIDSIDDTRDMIAVLENIGYKEGKDIEYVEVIDGEHNQKTWAEVMPIFLKWALKK